jgi:hypothetical protein
VGCVYPEFFYHTKDGPYPIYEAAILTGIDPVRLFTQYPESRARLLMNAALHIRLKQEYHVPVWVAPVMEGMVSMAKALLTVRI